MPKSKRLLPLLVLVLLVSACASDKRNEQLQDTLSTYAGVMRWGDFSRALSMVHPDSREDAAQLKLTMQRFDHIQVTSYRVISTQPGGDPDTVLQQAELRFSNRHTAVERAILDKQEWWWDAEKERWWLKSGLPDITRRGID